MAYWESNRQVFGFIATFHSVLISVSQCQLTNKKTQLLLARGETNGKRLFTSVNEVHCFCGTLGLKFLSVGNRVLYPMIFYWRVRKSDYHLSLSCVYPIIRAV